MTATTEQQQQQRQQQLAAVMRAKGRIAAATYRITSLARVITCTTQLTGDIPQKGARGGETDG